MKRTDVQKDKWYVVNCVTGRIKSGPYENEKQADQHLPENDPNRDYASFSGADYLDES